MRIRVEKMLSSSSFRKTVFISVIGHITVFSIFGLSFGKIIPKADYSTVSFWGQFLQSCQVAKPVPNNINYTQRFFTRTLIPTRNLIVGYENDWRRKPAFTLAFNNEKKVFIEEPNIKLSSHRRPEPTIIFHPLLPYGFTLYFKDRQLVHVELMFKIVSERERNSILIKRKISSGNLEVDLLAMRYIGHYLFIQQPNTLADNWQTVKIDLSAQEN